MLSDSAAFPSRSCPHFSVSTASSTHTHQQYPLHIPRRCLLRLHPPEWHQKAETSGWFGDNLRTTVVELRRSIALWTAPSPAHAVADRATAIDAITVGALVPEPSTG